MPTIRETLIQAARRLQAAGIQLAPQEAAWLLAHAMRATVSDLHLNPGRPVAPDAAAACASMVDRRCAREPIQYILGHQEFMGMAFRVTPAVLIPRPETEVLVRAVASRVRQACGPDAAVHLADIGTGSGCIAVGLCHLLPGARVWATDVSAAALAVAAENASRLVPGDRVIPALGDLYAALPPGARFHAVAANPPYIEEGHLPGLMPEVREYEPHLALTPGPDGLAVVRRLIAGARERLRPDGGFLALEVGYDQAEQAMALMAAHGLQPEAHRDDLGHPRCVIGAYC